MANNKFNKFKDLSHERVREAFDYDPETGALTWRINRHRARAGDKAGSNSPTGKLQVCLDRTNMQQQRLIWFWMTGEKPDLDIDHINGDPKDNRWCNLRTVTHEVNLQNRKGSCKGSAVPYLGVSKKRNKYLAQITASGVQYRLGVFATPEEAHEVYLKAKRILHSEAIQREKASV